MESHLQGHGQEDQSRSKRTLERRRYLPNLQHDNTSSAGAWPWTILLWLAAACIALVVGRSYYRLQHPSTHQDPVHRNDLGRWGCGMSWMSPGYIKVPVRIPDRPALERKYGLYLYREGGLSPEVDLSPRQLRGQPVLFIPGNAGDFRQVRSLASSAAHQFAQGEWSGREGYERWADEAAASGGLGARVKGMRELEFFTLDLNEEFSALHAHTLHTQAEYSAHAISAILELYQDGAGVWLVGHSMGGIVARHVMGMRLPAPPDSDRPTAPIKLVQEVVHVILTISTPNTLPPVSFDRGMERIYVGLYGSSATQAMSAGAMAEEASPGPIIIALCGGLADHQISSDGCPFSSEMASSNRGIFSVFTSGLELAWTDTDHNAAVWCEQTRWVIARTLLEMTAAGTHVKQASWPLRRDAMATTARRWLLGERDLREVGHSAASRSKPPAHALSVDKPYFETQSTGWQAYEILTDTAGSPAELQLLRPSRWTDLATNEQHGISAEVCGTTGQDCVPLRATSYRLLPPSRPGYRGLWPAPGKGTHAGESMIWSTYDLAAGEEGDANKTVCLLVHGPGWVVVGVSGSSTWRPLVKRFSVPPVSSLLVRHFYFARDAGCTEPSHFAPLLEARLAADAHAQLSESHFTPNLRTSTLVHFHSSSAPFLPASGKALEAFVWQEPGGACVDLEAGLHIKIDWTASAGVMVVRYRLLLLAWTLGVALLLIGKQVRAYNEAGIFPSTLTAVHGLVHQELPLLALGLLAFSALQATILRKVIPSSESYILGGVPLQLVVLVIPLLALAAGLVCVCSMLLSGMAVTLSPVVRMFGFLQLFEPAKSSKRLRARQISTILVLLALVTFLVPHQFAFVIAFVLHLGSTVAARAQGDASRYNYYHSILLLLLLLLPMNAAILVVWARNILSRWEILQPFGADHNPFVIAPVLALVESCAAGCMVRPLASRSRSRLAAAPFYIAGAFAFIAGARYTYGIYELSVIAVAGLVVWQIAAGREDSERKPGEVVRPP